MVEKESGSRRMGEQAREMEQRGQKGPAELLLSLLELCT